MPVESTIQDLTPVLDELRSVKSPREIALVRRASQLAGLGVLEAMRSTEPGAWEYQLDAAARYVFLQNGARLDGYRSITAAGTDRMPDLVRYLRAVLRRLDTAPEDTGRRQRLRRPHRLGPLGVRVPGGCEQAMVAARVLDELGRAARALLHVSEGCKPQDEDEQCGVRRALRLLEHAQNAQVPKC